MCLWATGGNLPSLAGMSVIVACSVLVACTRMHRLYSKAMWFQIERRELTVQPYTNGQELSSLAADRLWWIDGEGSGSADQPVHPGTGGGGGRGAVAPIDSQVAFSQGSGSGRGR